MSAAGRADPRLAGRRSGRSLTGWATIVVGLPSTKGVRYRAPFVVSQNGCRGRQDLSSSTWTGTGLATLLNTGEYFCAISINSSFSRSVISASILKLTRIFL